MPFSVSVRERCMYSHTLRFGVGEPFRTGCTSVVDATFTGDAVNGDGILIDITFAQAALRQILAMYDHKDLDGLAAFAGRNTTVEVVALEIFEQLTALCVSDPGAIGGMVTKLEIKLAESDVASASYFEEAPHGQGLFEAKLADKWKPRTSLVLETPAS